MPITARLSRRFYERLGDEITNELVDWLNAVDSSFRSELNEINERNWQRLRAELEARETRITARFAELDARLDKLGVEMKARFELAAADRSAGFARQEAKLLKWMFGFWVTTLVAIAGLRLF